MRRIRWLAAADLRSVGLFRITFGLVTLSEIADFSPFLRVGLSDEGFWPRSTALAGDVGRFSLMDVSGPPWVAYGYWMLTLVACACFVLGWHSRLATLATFVLATGMMERNPFICDYSDQVIRVLLFWSLFLPVGNWYSIDAALARAAGRPLPQKGSGLELRLIGLQLGWIYLCTFLWKIPGETWRDGTAVHFALGNDHDYTRTLGHLVRSMPWLTTAATYSTLVIEAAFLPLVFLPFWQPQAKAIALLSGAAMHVGIWVTMCVGEFSWLMIATYPLLFEPSWVDWTLARISRACAGVNVPIGPLFRMSLPLPALDPPNVPAIRAAETGPANRGYLLLAAQVVRGARWARQVALVALFAACVWSSTPLPTRLAIPDRLATVVRTVELWQWWAMFAPNPCLADVELVADGKLADGTKVDVLHGDEPAGPLPPAMHQFLASRWTDATNAIRVGEPPQLLQEFGSFLCRNWNREDRPLGRPLLATFQLSRVERALHPRDTGMDGPNAVVLWYHACLDSSHAANAP